MQTKNTARDVQAKLLERGRDTDRARRRQEIDVACGPIDSTPQVAGSGCDQCEILGISSSVAAFGGSNGVDQAQARAILFLKAEIVRIRSYGAPHLYKFWTFAVDEASAEVWTDGAATASVVWLTTDYARLDQTGYRDRRKFRIDPGGRVSLVQATSHDGSVIEQRGSGRLAGGVRRAVTWPGPSR